MSHDYSMYDYYYIWLHLSRENIIISLSQFKFEHFCKNNNNNNIGWPCFEHVLTMKVFVIFPNSRGERERLRNREREGKRERVRYWEIGRERERLRNREREIEK